MELAVPDSKIVTSIGPLTKDGKKIAKKVINDVNSKADKALFKANDGVSMTVAVIDGKFKAVQKIANGNAPSPASVEISKIYDELNDQIIDTGLGNNFIQTLFEADFRSATAVLLKLKPEDAYAAIAKLDEIASTTLAKINGVDTKRSGPIVSAHKKEIAFFLERLPTHSADLLSFLKERHAIEGRAAVQSGKTTPKIKRSLEGDLKLPGGATIGGSMAGKAGAAMRGATSAQVSNVRLLDKNIN
jgi:hypothetical protein